MLLAGLDEIRSCLLIFSVCCVRACAEEETHERETRSCVFVECAHYIPHTRHTFVYMYTHTNFSLRRLPWAAVWLAALHRMVEKSKRPTQVRIGMGGCKVYTAAVTVRNRHDCEGATRVNGVHFLNYFHSIV